MSLSGSAQTPVVVGIDLGTTFCAIAYVDANDEPQTIINHEGDLTTPSAALIEGDEIVIGKQAIKAQVTIPGNVATFAKRDIGKAAISRPVDGKAISPEVIQSLILKRLKQDAEEKLERPVRQAVITVPAYFNETKRRSTIRSAKLAGLEVLAIINEPTAAAIAYGLKKHSQIFGPQTVLIYDLGGGTFDVSLVKVEKDEINVIATDGNAMLGGIDWDRCLVAWLDDRFLDQCGYRPSETDTGKTWLLHEAMELKHALTSRTSVKVRLTYQTHTLQATITREEFEEMTAHLLDRTRFTINKLLKEARLAWEAVTEVILVGGSTRMPQVAALIGRLADTEANMSVSADEAIAHGAAIYAQSLARSAVASSKPTLRVRDVNAHNLSVIGIDTKTGLRVSHVMIPRNTSIPIKQVTRFETLRDNQPSVVVEVVEGGDSRGRYGAHIGRCVLTDMPADLPRGTPVDVTFQYDRDSLMTIEARLPSTGQKATIKIQRNATSVPSELISDLNPEWSIVN